MPTAATHAEIPGPAAPHRPVLLAEVLEAVKPRAGELHLDGTFGAGGYARALLAAAPDLRVLALDRDPTALEAGAGLAAEAAGRLTLVPARFGALDTAARAVGLGLFDGVVLDVGVSSMQLDRAERGFSFRFDGPLDMRMGPADGPEGPSAADLVNGLEEADLANLIYAYGEDRLSRVIAQAIVAARPLATTGELASIISRVVRTKPGEMHPATRTFQALRIAVNDELGELARALHAAERVLRPGGRLVVVAFHSLEDRLVKRFLSARAGRGQADSRLLPGEPARAAPTFAVRGPQPVTPGEVETAANPRARSARLRVAVRTEAPAGPPVREVLDLAAPPPPASRQAVARTRERAR